MSFFSLVFFGKLIKASLKEIDISLLHCVILPGFIWLCGMNYTDKNLQTLQDTEFFYLRIIYEEVLHKYWVIDM